MSCQSSLLFMRTPQVLVTVPDFHTLTLKGHRVLWLLCSPEVHHKVLWSIFSCRWFCWHHTAKLSTRLLFSSIAESSENIWRWHELELYWKSVVQSVKIKADSPVPWGLLFYSTQRQKSRCWGGQTQVCRWDSRSARWSEIHPLAFLLRVSQQVGVAKMLNSLEMSTNSILTMFLVLSRSDWALFSKWTMTSSTRMCIWYANWIGSRNCFTCILRPWITILSEVFNMMMWASPGPVL